MNSKIKSCYLISQSKSKLPNIFVPDKKEIFVGRQVETKVDDIKCSRHQRKFTYKFFVPLLFRENFSFILVRLTANYEKKYVKIEQVGIRPSGFNGCKILKDQPHLAENGDHVELLYGKHPYIIEFNPPPPLFVKKEKIPSKRSLSQESEEEEFSSSIKKANLMERVEEESVAIAGASGTKNELNSNYGTWEEVENKSLYIYTPSGCPARPKVSKYSHEH